MCWSGTPAMARSRRTARSTRSGEASTRLYHRTPVTASRLDHPDRESIARQPAAHEHHVAAEAPDAFAPEGQVVDANGDTITASGSWHDAATIKSGLERVNSSAPIQGQRRALAPAAVTA